MSGWSTLFDVANLAINIGQSAQLAEQREKLHSLQEHAMIEALRQKLIELMRDDVFTSGEQLKVLAEYREEAPQAVFVATSVMAWKFEAGGITPEAFPEFRDKEYVQQVRERLQDTLEDARSRLDASELREAEQCVQAIIQMPLLNETIDVQPAIESLAETKAEWEQLGSVRSKYAKQGWIVGLAIALAGPVILASVCGLLAFLASTAQLGELASLLTCGTFLSPLFAPVGVVVGIMVGSKGKTAEWKELKAQREARQKEVPEESHIQQIRQVLGVRTSEGYKALRVKREELIHRIFSGAKKFALPVELLDSVSQEALE